MPLTALSRLIPVSAYGGIAAFNRPVDETAARLVADHFMEVVIAPEFSPEALEILQHKKNLRLLAAGEAGGEPWVVRTVSGGLWCRKPTMPYGMTPTCRR